MSSISAMAFFPTPLSRMSSALFASSAGTPETRATLRARAEQLHEQFLFVNEGRALSLTVPISFGRLLAAIVILVIVQPF
jgi:hypothetical protein